MGVRLVTDYKEINKYIDRPVHPFPSCKDVLRGIKPDSRWFLKFDAMAGYHQIPLDDESSKLTTFLVERGRYRYTRAPMGLNLSSDHFCERTDIAFVTIKDLLKNCQRWPSSSPNLASSPHNFSKSFRVLP